jgi:hypothetical protein
MLQNNPSSVNLCATEAEGGMRGRLPHREAESPRQSFGRLSASSARSLRVAPWQHAPGADRSLEARHNLRAITPLAKKNQFRKNWPFIPSAKPNLWTTP